MILFKQYTMTATAASLSSNALLGSVLPVGVTKVHQVFITNAPAAVNNIFGGGSGVTNVPANAGFAIAFSATLAITFSLGPFVGAQIIDLNDIYIVGTVNAANIAYLTAILG